MEQLLGESTLYLFLIKFNCTQNAVMLVLFPIDFAYRKSLTESVYLTIVLLQPPASIATSFFCALIFDTSWFYVKRTLSVVLSLSSVAFLIKKEVRVAFGVISDTARREIGFNVYFFSAIQQKNIRCPSPRSPTFERTTSNRYFSTAVFSTIEILLYRSLARLQNFPEVPFFSPRLFLFLIVAARFVLRKFDIAQRSMGARIHLCQLTYPVAYRNRHCFN